MTAKVERWAAPLRRAVTELANGLAIDETTFRCLFAPRLSGLGFYCDQSELANRAAWALAAQWLAGYASGALPAEASLRDAEDWFLGGLPLPSIAPPKTHVGQAIGLIDRQTAYALMPYLLDPLAPATRRHVMGNGGLAQDRASRKASGVYYTPGDLAERMASGALTPAVGSCVDPACGSGVFLRAAAAGRPGLALYGCDIAPLAAEMCAYVLLASEPEGRRGPVRTSPWVRWHQSRIRLATCDALTLRPGTDLSEVAFRARLGETRRVRAELAMNVTAPPAPTQAASEHLGSLFPEIAGGADLLLTNPPYAKLGAHPRQRHISELYASFAEASPTAGTNTYLPFVEHAWRLTHQRGRASLVVPLSIAFGSARQLQALRQAIASQTGRWRIAFFDRAPDALFGDDIKTRNAVLTFGADETPGIETTELLRWTSRTRKAFFGSFSYASINGVKLNQVIPKLGSSMQTELYKATRDLPGCLGAAASTARKQSARSAARQAGADAVHVAGTAYNWLSCARDLSKWRTAADLSESPMSTLCFGSAELADAAYAVLASRLTLWLWRVEGDAFHVSTRFLTELPFDLTRLTINHVAALARVGRRLWMAVSGKPVISVNRSRQSVGFAAYQAPDELDAVDDQVLEVFRLGQHGARFDLRAWYQQLLVVDHADERRLALVPGPGGTPSA